MRNGVNKLLNLTNYALRFTNYESRFTHDLRQQHVTMGYENQDANIKIFRKKKRGDVKILSFEEHVILALQMIPICRVRCCGKKGLLHVLAMVNAGYLHTDLFHGTRRILVTLFKLDICFINLNYRFG